jgi:hypothetical protein
VFLLSSQQRIPAPAAVSPLRAATTNVFIKIQRLLLSQLQDALIPGEVLVLYGPRQVGKTTLVQDLIAAVPLRSRFVNADELLYREALASQNRQRLGEVLGDAELLVIDEAQRVPEIGLNLKILVDMFQPACQSYLST